MAKDWIQGATYYLFESHGANVVYAAELGMHNYKTVNILVSEGHQGIGKSTYAFNIMRAGAVKARLTSVGAITELNRLYKRWVEAREKCGDCEEAQATWQELAETLRKELNRIGVTCWGAYCEEPDSFDKKYIVPYIFTTDATAEEFLARIKDIVEKKAEPLPRAFVDDYAVYRDVYLSGGLERKVYVELKKLFQYRRAFSRIFVATALTRVSVMKELLRTSVVIDAAQGDNSNTVVFTRWVLRNAFGGYVDGAKAYRMYKFLGWRDVVRVGEAFAAPRWLDDLMMARKREAVKTAAERALEALRAAKNSWF
ncbi:MAG: hypothetical protein ABWK05_06905 [Pyrobaculum sp.]